MALTLNRLTDLATSTFLGGSPSAASSVILLANQTGRHVMNMHRWKWAEGNTAYLPWRISVPTTASTGGTLSGVWTESTKRLVLSGAFASYQHRTGDLLQTYPATDESVVPGLWEIAGKVDDNTIELVTSPMNDTVVTATIEFAIDLAYADLPADFGDLVSVEALRTTSSVFDMVSMETLNWLRSSEDAESYLYRGAINYTRPSVSAPGVPRLELYPPPNTNNNKALRCVYRSGWLDLNDDDTVLPVPSFMEPLFLEVYRCFLLGYEEHDLATVNARLAEVQIGPVFRAATAADGRKQGTHGPMKNTHVRRSDYGNWQRSSINSPA